MIGSYLLKSYCTLLEASKGVFSSHLDSWDLSSCLLLIKGRIWCNLTKVIGTAFPVQLIRPWKQSKSEF